jgi:hypothetical protein
MAYLSPASRSCPCLGCIGVATLPRTASESTQFTRVSCDRDQRVCRSCPVMTGLSAHTRRSRCWPRHIVARFARFKRQPRQHAVALGGGSQGCSAARDPGTQCHGLRTQCHRHSGVHRRHRAPTGARSTAPASRRLSRPRHPPARAARPRHPAASAGHAATGHPPARAPLSRHPAASAGHAATGAPRPGIPPPPAGHPAATHPGCAVAQLAHPVGRSAISRVRPRAGLPLCNRLRKGP